MRVLVDTSPARRARSGTSVYLERILDALRARGVVEVVEARQRLRLRPGGAGRRRNPLRSAVNLLLDLGWLHVGLPRAARAAGAEVLHHPVPAHSSRSPCPQVVTVQDVAFERLPDAFDPAWRRVARRRHRAGVRRAGAVVCISEATAAEAAELLGAPRERIVVAPLGPGQELPAVERREPPEHFLYVGDAEPRKGVADLIARHADYRSGRDDALELVLAGAAAGPPLLPAAGVRGEPDPDAERLAELYAGAAALVHPSAHEGFGLTLLEAMSLGAPVVAVRNPAVEEVCGDAAMLVERAALAAAMDEVHDDPALRARLSEAGRARAARFSWDEAARLHEAAYTLAAKP